MNRVPGQPLFTENLNCHCFDPSKTFVLNPAAWVNPPAGQYGTAAAYYSDYRFVVNCVLQWQHAAGADVPARGAPLSGVDDAR